MKRLAPLVLAALLAGCGGLNLSRVQGNFPKTGTLIPSGNVSLAPSFSIPFEKLVFVGAYAGIAYLVLDPLAPNWEIEEAKIPDDRYLMSLQMKRYYAGGAGEARAVFHRRAAELVRAGDADGYEVLEYTESMNSSVLGSQRVAAGVIQLTRKD
ncbi:MAG: hypothetical protein HZC24_03075 [Rhodocyclales bacterium]|nr:hypothetical protein [Rhodocyclales bacterium]